MEKLPLDTPTNFGERCERLSSCDSGSEPGAGPKEVLMRVRASSLNHRDLMVRKRTAG